MWQEQDLDFFRKKDIRFVYEDLSELPDGIKVDVENAQHKVNDALDFQLKMFKSQKEAILKYKEENGMRFSREEEALMEKTALINNSIENIKENILALETKIKEEEANLAHSRTEALKMESEKKHLLTEKNKMIENLEKTRSAYRAALSLYQRTLGIVISPDIADSRRFTVTFQPDVNAQHSVHHKISVLRLDDGYQLSNGLTLRTKCELMSHLSKERRQWLAS